MFSYNLEKKQENYTVLDKQLKILLEENMKAAPDNHTFS